MSEPIHLSVVLPCRNQADHIARIVRLHAAALARIGRSFEIVLVPNACTDETAAIVRGLAVEDSRVRCRESAEGGWGRAVRAGLEAARGEVLCYANSARTDPDLVPHLLQQWSSADERVLKIRREQRGAPLREIGSWLYNLEVRCLFGTACRDVNGTPKIFSRRLYERLDLRSNGDVLDAELVIQATRLGAAIVDVPVQGFARHGGVSTTNWTSAWRMYRGAFALRAALAGFPARSP